MKKQHTSRGFAYRKFDDIYKYKCIIQESSLADKPAIWLGTTEERMHIDRPLARKLVKYLNKFIETGNI
jgi:hypothetical protein